MNAAALSPPVSLDDSDFSPINYQAYSVNAASNNNSNSHLKGNPDTPPVSSHTSASTSTTDGGMQNGSRGPNGNPSPPSSVSRSSDGNGLYAPSLAGSVDSRRAYMMEESLSEHYRVLKNFLLPYLNSEKSDLRQNRARDKLLRLSSVQFQELSTDVYDELLRREDERRRGGPGAPGNSTPKNLLPKPNFHFKRNQARQKLSTLPADRFRQLATDVFYELERRYPKFAGGDRPASRAGSIASIGPGRFQAPPRTASRGTADMPRAAPPPFRNGPPFDGPPPGIQPGLDTPPSDFGRPLPKTFQSNTIIPNKGMMVEDDDDDDADRGFNGVPDGDVVELRSQVSQLERKVDELEAQLREKSVELEKAQSSNQDRDSSTEQERSEWNNLRFNLEAKLKEAQDLNDNLQAELDRVRSENEASERDLRAQIDDAQRNERAVEQDLKAQVDEAKRQGMDVERELRAQLDSVMVNNNTRSRSRADSAPGEWRERYEALERELAEQRQTTEEVRRDAAQFLQEMRTLSEQSADALEKEDQLLDQVSALEREVREWKSRYAKIKGQNRSLRASSMGLPGINADASQYSRDAEFTAPDGMIKDFHVTNYQLAIDELLQLARKPDASEPLVECMKQVVLCVRQISADIESLSTPQGSMDGSDMDTAKEHAKLRARLSQTANNLITATKAHAAAAGLAPVSLVDAAASHLTAAVVDLVRTVKICPTPADELDRDDLDDRVAKPAPLNMRGKTPTRLSEGSMTNGKVNGVNGHVRNQSSIASSGGYSAYSRYSSRYSNNMSPAREGMANGDVNGKGLGISQPMGMVRESGIEEFKNYLEDSTALLVRSIQPLVNTVRLGNTDDAAITEYIRDISATVQDIVLKTNEAIYELRDPALEKHAPPAIKVLENSGMELVRLDEEGQDKNALPPVAFRIARATKELVLRVDRIEARELTADMTLPTEF